MVVCSGGCAVDDASTSLRMNPKLQYSPWVMYCKTNTDYSDQVCPPLRKDP